MPDKKKIKINFADMWNNFNPNTHWVTVALKKYYDVEFSEEPDFLFYECFGPEHLKYKNCVKIFFTGENVLPDFNECDYATGFDYINFGDRYFKKDYFVPPRTISDRSAVTDDMFDRRFCNFIYSNANSGEGAVLRQEFCKKLMEYKRVDCPGKILNNMSADDLEPRNGNWWGSKQKFLNKYKFTIAFENSSSNGYTTEKLIHPLLSHSIPIYWGNPLVVRDFNPRAFINCNDYDNDFDAIIARIKELDNDPDKYLAMLRENPMQPDFDFDQGAKLEKWLCNIIERGNKPFNKDPRNFSYRMSGRHPLEQENQKLSAEISTLRAELDDANRRILDSNKHKEQNTQLQQKLNESLTQNQNLSSELEAYKNKEERRKYDVRRGHLWRRKESAHHIKIYIFGIRILKYKKK